MAVDVSTQSVRDLIDDTASKSIKDATIQANINRSKRCVVDVQSSTAKDTRVEDAIRAMATWLTYGSYSEGISQQLGGVPVSIQAKFDHFRKVAELMINKVSRELVDLDVDSMSEQPLIGDDIGIYTMTISEAYTQSV